MIKKAYEITCDGCGGTELRTESKPKKAWANDGWIFVTELTFCHEDCVRQYYESNYGIKADSSS